jgi:SAM-dependent methyltransferase
VLDVGCGNHSPARTKRIRPDCVYVGLDVADYNQDIRSTALADKYLLCRPEEFVARLLALSQSADAVISSHNIEHCLAPEKVLRAMCDALKTGGRMFLSLPCAASVSFPSRAGTLNYFDDVTHREPPDLNRLLEILAEKKLTVEYVSRRYRPVPLFLLGVLLEPLSMILKRNMPLGSTWALYGFESIVWATKS